HLRLRTGLSFQGGALRGSLSVLDNVALPLRENTTLPPAVVREIARMKLDMVGLLHAADLLPSSLSGGLDPITAAEIDNVITKLNAVFGITMVVVTHDLPSAYSIASRICVLLDGKVKALGERDKVWHDPDPQLRAFIERRRPSEEQRGMDVITHLEI
ncbi:MAG: ABC transporter ATP-binding protein, partial [Planctomycetes bacterium]|nr:ABC transporter ATP-binding protein [Planctomycetota bacterium]